MRDGPHVGAVLVATEREGRQAQQPPADFRARTQREAAGVPGRLATARSAPVLVVDDDPAILATVTDVLEFEGYEVRTASNGAEALRSLERGRPSLVLLDMRMPVLDGWGFARELRRRGLDVPIVVMTAAQNAQRWAEEIGATGFVAKPFELPELIEAVERGRDPGQS